MKSKDESTIGQIFNIPETNIQVKVTRHTIGFPCSKCYFLCLRCRDRSLLKKFEKQHKINCLDDYYYEEVKL